MSSDPKLRRSDQRKQYCRSLAVWYPREQVFAPQEGNIQWEKWVHCKAVVWKRSVSITVQKVELYCGMRVEVISSPIHNVKTSDLGRSQRGSCRLVRPVRLQGILSRNLWSLLLINGLRFSGNFLHVKWKLLYLETLVHAGDLATRNKKTKPLILSGQRGSTESIKKQKPITN